ncbi:hypothetical protein BHE74_00049409, partial [Ensete ventricosum]
CQLAHRIAAGIGRHTNPETGSVASFVKYSQFPGPYACLSALSGSLPPAHVTAHDRPTASFVPPRRRNFVSRARSFP